MPTDSHVFLKHLSTIKHDLPFSPVLMQKIFLQTSANSRDSLEKVAETMARDQGLTAKVLALANSAFYGLQSQVTTVARAAAILGLAEIRNIVTALGMGTLSRKYTLPKAFDLTSYWKHQLLVAMIARELARTIGHDNPEDLFTSGLLHDLGSLLVAMHCPVDWQIMNEMASTGEFMPREAEDRHWGLDHAVIGTLVLKSWDFPEALVEPINWHHAPELGGAFQRQASIVCLADALAHLILQDIHPNLKGVYQEVHEKHSLALGFSPEALLGKMGADLEEDSIERFVKLLI